MTIVAYANGRIKVLKIRSVEKRKLIRTLRELERPRQIYIYKIFSGLIYFLLREERADQVLIDKEYPGHEGTIKAIVIQVFRKENKKEPDISFGYVKKTSLAHKTALAAFRRELKPNIVVKATPDS